MELKINKYTFNVTNKDWILDNGSCYQCMTLKHSVYEQNIRCSRDHVTIMGKNQFKQLVKENKLIDYTEKFHIKHPTWYVGCKIWKFNMEE